MIRAYRINKILRRVNQVLLFGLLLGAAAFAIYLTHLAFQTPAKYVSFHLHETKAVAGSTVTYDFHFYRYVGPEVQTNVVVNLVPVDRSGRPIKGTTPTNISVSPNVSTNAGYQEANNRNLTIPQDTAAGCYRVHRIGQYYTLSFRPKSVDIYSNEICVTAYVAPSPSVELQQIESQLQALERRSGVAVIQSVSSVSATKTYPAAAPVVSVEQTPAAAHTSPTTEPTSLQSDNILLLQATGETNALLQDVLK